MGVSSDPSCTPRILECFLLCDNAFPNTSPTMTPLETSLGHRTLWKEVFIFLRSKGNLWIRVSTDKGAATWAPTGLTPSAPLYHLGACTKGSAVGTAHTVCRPHRLQGQSTAQPPPGGAGARDAVAHRRSEHSLEKSREPDPSRTQQPGLWGVVSLFVLNSHVSP